MKKIIITGAARSGTSVISNLLSMSPKIIVTPELGIFHPNQKYAQQRIPEYIANDSRIRDCLEYKNITIDDINNFLNGDYSNRGDLEFFGDKWPTYCTSQEICSHMVEKHSDAYFIFTDRNPCATMYSRLYRTIKENNISEHEKDLLKDWYVKSIEEATRNLIKDTSNWINYIYPKVQKKIIINYENAINNFDSLIAELEDFFGITLDLPEKEKMINYSSIPQDVGYQEKKMLYKSSTIDSYKEGLTQNEINYITSETKQMTMLIENLVKLKR